MKRNLSTTVGIGAIALGIAATSTLSAGAAAAAGKGIALEGVAKAKCQVTIKLTNHTNSTYYQPDWWFEQENDLTLVNAMTAVPADQLKAPWRATNGVPWPMARWVGDPVLHSEVAPGVPVFKPPTVGYNSAAQPDGLVSERTIDLRKAANAPKPSKKGTMTIYFRVKSGPATGDQLRTPQKLVVSGCRSVTGSLDFGSVDLPF